MLVDPTNLVREQLEGPLKECPSILVVFTKLLDGKGNYVVSQVVLAYSVVRHPALSREVATREVMIVSDIYTDKFGRPKVFKICH